MRAQGTGGGESDTFPAAAARIGGLSDVSDSLGAATGPSCGKAQRLPLTSVEHNRDAVGQHFSTDRQLAVIRPEDAKAWLTLGRPEEELLRPLERGSYVVEKVG